jgi:hypothetical protein
VPAVPAVAVDELYHFTVPLHPLALRFTVPVPHLEFPVVVGAVGMALIVAVVVVLVELTQVPTVQSAKYGVVVEILGVVKLVPAVPAVAVDELYHFTVPPQPLALRVTVPVPHLEFPVVDGADGMTLIVATTGPRVAPGIVQLATPVHKT